MVRWLRARFPEGFRGLLGNLDLFQLSDLSGLLIVLWFLVLAGKTCPRGLNRESVFTGKQLMFGAKIWSAWTPRNGEFPS